MKNGAEKRLPKMEAEMSIWLTGTRTRGLKRIAAQDLLFHLVAISDSAPVLKTVHVMLAFT